MIADLGLSYVLLADDDQPATAAIRAQYAAIMRRSGTALAEGGVHTPNHRWEICKALAHLNHLWPSRLLKARINDWLGEGIDQDAEGEYSERSPNYASEVTNKSLLTIARYAALPTLRSNVRRNLQLTLYRIQPNGEVETVQSRRQDQTGVQDVWKYLTHYRELAIRDRNGQFAAVAAQILDRVAANPATFATSGYSVGEFLAEALAYPDITAALPPSTPVPTTYTKTSKGSQLVSLRRGSTTAVIFGGTDWHNKRVDSEGQSHQHPGDRLRAVDQPDVLQVPQGRGDPGLRPAVPALLQHRPLPQRRRDRASRGGWRLADEVAVAYHLPLPQRRRRSDGAYVLGSEGRFYSKMDFPHRPKDEKVLDDDDHDHRGRHRRLRPRLRSRRSAHLAHHRALLPLRWHPRRRRARHAATATSSWSRGRAATPSVATRSPSDPVRGAGSSNRSRWTPARSTPTSAAT